MTYMPHAYLGTQPMWLDSNDLTGADTTTYAPYHFKACEACLASNTYLPAYLSYLQYIASSHEATVPRPSPPSLLASRLKQLTARPCAAVASRARRSRRGRHASQKPYSLGTASYLANWRTGELVPFSRPLFCASPGRRKFLLSCTLADWDCPVQSFPLFQLRPGTRLLSY